MAHAVVSSAPQKKIHPMVKYADKYPWVFKVENVELNLNAPIAVDAEMRSHLDEFKGRDLKKVEYGLFKRLGNLASKTSTPLPSRDTRRSRGHHATARSRKLSGYGYRGRNSLSLTWGRGRSSKPLNKLPSGSSSRSACPGTPASKYHPA